MFTQIKKCRVCGNPELAKVVDLGEQHLTGVFPKTQDMNTITKGPLRLVKCHSKNEHCGLLQLEHSYSLSEMYGENYGYRSGLNLSMVRHLEKKVAQIQSAISLKAGDLVIDIGSNDGTTLGFYPENLDLFGVDPTGAKFRKYYKPHINLIPDFFSGKTIQKALGERKAKVVTSFSMFYDLEDPVAFASEIASVLDPQSGVWIFEQSYMPEMLKMNSYDTICHEHLEYYGLQQVRWIVEKAGMKLIDVDFNDVNGGSFSVTAALKSSTRPTNDSKISATLEAETKMGLNTLKPYEDFQVRIRQTREELLSFLKKAKDEGKKVYGLGASTKGNVLLQYCGVTSKDIEAIADVNPDKFGSFAPGTAIPIEDEKKSLEKNPDYLLVLPWHFRDFFLNSKNFKARTLVFPLPAIDVVKVQ